MESAKLIHMADEVIIIDKPLKCLICGNDKFTTSGVRLNSTKGILFNAELFSKGGKAYICDNCGFAHQFFK